MAKDDMYWVDCVTSNPSWILTDSCFWDIDVIDIPKTKSLWGAPVFGNNKKSGVYDFGFGQKTRLSDRFGNTKLVINNGKIVNVEVINSQITKLKRELREIRAEAAKALASSGLLLIQKKPAAAKLKKKEYDDLIAKAKQISNALQKLTNEIGI